MVEYYVPRNQWEQEVAAIERHTGGSYDALTHLDARYSNGRQVDASALVKRHGWKHLADTLLLPGASEVFQALDKRSLPYGIFTKGGKAFQSLKVALLCAMVGEKTIPYQVTSIDKKATYIAKHWWSDGEQVFIIPDELSGVHGLSARRVVIVDDKLDNLVSSHGRITPYHVSVDTVQNFVDSIDNIVAS